MEINFFHGRVEFAIVNVNPPFRRKTCLNRFPLIIGGDCDADFLGDDMNEANPLAVRNRVYDISIQPFDDFFFNCCPENII